LRLGYIPALSLMPVRRQANERANPCSTILWSRSCGGAQSPFPYRAVPLGRCTLHTGEEAQSMTPPGPFSVRISGQADIGTSMPVLQNLRCECLLAARGFVVRRCG